MKIKQNKQTLEFDNFETKKFQMKFKEIGY